MAYQNVLETRPMVAESVFSEKYVVCILGTGDNSVKLPDATSDNPHGVVQAVTTASGQSVPVGVSGITKVVANGAFSKGDFLGIAATTGRVDTITGIDETFSGASSSTAKILGIALEAAGAAAEIVAMEIRVIYYPT